MNEEQKALLCDPQTSGGLLIAVSNSHEAELLALLGKEGLPTQCIGHLAPQTESQPLVELI